MFPYTTHVLSERGIKKTIQFIITSERTKYPGKNDVTKEVKDMYIIYYKTLMKEIEDGNKWKDSQCS